MTSPQSDRGALLTEFIEAQLLEERSRADQLNAAAEKILTTSAAFIALIVAIAALVLGKDFAIAGSDVWAVAARLFSLLAIGAFGVTAFLATRVQTLRKLQTASDDALEVMLKAPAWNYTQAKARSVKAYHLVVETTSMRKANNDRAGKLKLASNWQASAAGFVVLAVVCGFFAAPPT